MKKYILLVIFLLLFSICYAQHKVILKSGGEIEGDEIIIEKGSIMILRGKADRDKTGYDWKEVHSWPLFEVKSINGIPLDREDEAKSYYEYGNLYLYKDKNYKQAIEFYEKAIKLKPEFPEAIVNLMLCYHHDNRFEDSVKLGKQAVIDFPNDEVLHYNLAIAYSILGKDVDAVMHYKKVISLKPDSGMAYANLGTLYFNMGGYKEAEENLLKAKGLLTDNEKKEFLSRIDEMLRKIQSLYLK